MIVEVFSHAPALYQERGKSEKLSCPFNPTFTTSLLGSSGPGFSAVLPLRSEIWNLQVIEGRAIEKRVCILVHFELFKYATRPVLALKARFQPLTARGRKLHSKGRVLLHFLARRPYCSAIDGHGDHKEPQVNYLWQKADSVSLIHLCTLSIAKPTSSTSALEKKSHLVWLLWRDQPHRISFPTQDLREHRLCCPGSASSFGFHKNDLTLLDAVFSLSSPENVTIGVEEDIDVPRWPVTFA